MPSNDESVLAIPTIQCPSCKYTLDLSGSKVGKYTKAQRKRIEDEGRNMTASTSNYRQDPTGEDNPSSFPEKEFMLVTCSNIRCEQYNKIKVLELPKLRTPSVKIEL